jgi:hypothetical protein
VGRWVGRCGDVGAKVGFDFDDAAGEPAGLGAAGEQFAEQRGATISGGSVKNRLCIFFQLRGRAALVKMGSRSGFVGFNCGQDFFGVALGLDLGEDLQELLVGTDDECGAFDADHFLAVHVLFLEHPKLIADDFVYICEERIGQVVLFAEFALRFWGVAGDSEDDGAGFLELFKGVAEAAGLNGAARSVRLGIKEEYDWLSGEVGEMDGLVLIVLEGEVGNFFVQFHE